MYQNDGCVVLAVSTSFRNYFSPKLSCDNFVSAMLNLSKQLRKHVFHLISSCQPAAQMLQSNGELKRKWTWAVEWLNDELDRVTCF